MVRSPIPEQSPDGSTSSILCTILERVSERTGRDVTKLPPLYETVDPEVLSRLVDSATETTSLSIQFTYAGHQVTVDANGAVECSPAV